MTIRPRRSVLYMPGSNLRALEKARTLPADGLILDLEDAVAPEAKATARQQVVDAIAAQNSKLNGLAHEQQEMQNNLAAVASPDTSAAADFNNQLNAAILLLQVETGDATFRMASLKDFLAKNF